MLVIIILILKNLKYDKSHVMILTVKFFNKLINLKTAGSILDAFKPVNGLYKTILGGFLFYLLRIF